ncbi:ABC transporter permease [Arthrobacter flavus]|uniref:FtsX-like permease family protein n=1 Tax=Arthrobacter flavus TaxID=95172 RepID=A0ABW4Q6V6_9MICC
MKLFFLLRRQFRRYRGPSILLAVIVLAVSALLTLWPRAIDDMFAKDLRQTMGNATGSQRDFIGYLSAPPPLTDLNTGFADANPGATFQLRSMLAEIRDGLPEPLHSVTGEARWVVAGYGAIVRGPFPTGIASVELNYAAGPAFLDHIDLVHGVLPGPLSLESADTDPLEILLSVNSADAAGWEIGEERAAGVRRLYGEAAPPPDRPLVLTGTFTPKDADNPYWSINTSILNAVEEVNPNTGTLVTATAVVSPDAFAPTFGQTERTQTTMWLPLDGSSLDAASAPLVEAQLRQAVGSPRPIPNSTMISQTAQFNSGAPALIAESTQRAASTNQILALLASGPLGVCLATAAVAVRLVYDRRRTAIALAGARGASAAQLRTILGMEGLAIGLPSALLGTLLATALIPVPLNLLHFGWAAGAALVPALLLALPHPTPSLRQNRGDLAPRSLHRWRLAAEGLTLGLAVTATTLLFQRGLDQRGVELGTVDPLLAATPLLIALAACVVVLRLYPLPLARYAKRQQRRPGLVGFLGAARAVRAPGGGLLAVLTLIVGLGVVIFAGILLSTFRAGVTAAAQYEVGADLRVQGSLMSTGTVDQIRSLDGVEELAGITDLGQLRVSADDAGENTLVRVLAVDPSELRTVQRGSAGAFPAALLSKLEQPAPAGALPVVVSGAVGLELGGTGTLGYRDSSRAIDVVGVGPPSTPLASGSNWMLVSTKAVNALEERTFDPSVVFIRLAPGIDDGSIQAQLVDLVPTPILVQTPTQFEDQTLQSPSGLGLQTGLWTVITAMGVLCALTILMTAVVNAPARNHLVALLRTLGFPRNRDGAVLLWELGPVAGAALVMGTILGFAFPVILLDSIDLAVFTGGEFQPAARVDLALTAGLLGGFVGVTALAIAVAVVMGRRQRIAIVLRMTDS